MFNVFVIVGNTIGIVGGIMNIIDGETELGIFCLCCAISSLLLFAFLKTRKEN